MFYLVNLLILLLIWLLVYNTNYKRKVTTSDSYLEKENRKRDKRFLILTGIQLFFIMALRATTVGTDTDKYILIYKRAVLFNDLPIIQFLQLDRTFIKAPLFFGLLKYYSKLFPQPQAFIIFMAFFTIFFYWMAFYISKVDCKKAVLLFYLIFFLQALNANRSCLAIGIFCFGYILFEQGKRIAGILLILAATLVHNSAVIGFGILGLSYINFRNKQVRFITVVILIAVSLSYRRFLPLFLRLFPIYEKTIEVSSFEVSSRAIVIQVIFLASLLQSMAVIKKKNSIVYEETVNLERLNILMVGELLLAFVGRQLWYVMRFVHFLQVFVFFQWPAVSRYKTKYRVFYKIVVYGMAFFYFGYRLYKNHGAVLPYRFFWE